MKMVDLSRKSDNDDISTPGLAYSAENLSLVREYLPILLDSVVLNTVQDAIFCQCWLGATYRDIAKRLDYDASYIRLMGAQLWQLLSEKLGQKVTKSNFQSILMHHLNQYQKSAPLGLPERGAWPSGGRKVEISLGSERWTFKHYIDRFPIESQCYSTILQEGALIRIKAPQEMGKTLLMSKILNNAHQHQIIPVALSLRLADADTFAGLGRFLQWFCLSIGDQLNLPNQLHQFWDDCFSSSYNCTNYLERVILPATEAIVVALDDVDVLFQYPKIATDFLGMLRAWSEKAKHVNASSQLWKRCRFIVIHSTDVYIPLNKHQSPFNIGLSIELPEFTKAQVAALAHQFQLTLKDSDIQHLMDLVGGKPKLITLVFSAMVDQSATLSSLLQEPIHSTSLFYEHLRSQYRKLQRYPELQPSFEQIVTAEQPIAIAPIQGYQLESLGLVALESGTYARPSCSLYRQYFRQLFE